MAPTGSPTNPPEHTPRFADPDADAFKSPDANPYVTEHRTFGLPLLPAREAWPWRGRWDEHFGREAPLMLEIGSGNGFFLAGMAEAHPDWNLLGIEIRYKRVVLTAKKLRKMGVENARIVRYSFWYLDDLFLPGSLSGLFINHPDPWPKTKHEKNRLISRWFLEEAAMLLAPGASLRLKSDHAPNADRLIELLDRGPRGEERPRLPFEVVGRSDDIEAQGTPWDGDVETNYQAKFRRMGLPVHAVELRRT